MAFWTKDLAFTLVPAPGAMDKSWELAIHCNAESVQAQLACTSGTVTSGIAIKAEGPGLADDENFAALREALRIMSLEQNLKEIAQLAKAKPTE
jgi:hypothetical protein